MSAGHIRRDLAEDLLCAAQSATTHVRTEVRPGTRNRRVADTDMIARGRIDRVPAGIDGFGIRKPDDHVEVARPELLEVGRLIGLEEGFVRRATVKSVGLEPFLAPGNAVRARVRHDFVEARIQIGDDRLADEGRLVYAVRLEFRAGGDHAHEVVLHVRRGQIVSPGDRAGVQTRDGILGAGQGIGDGLVEHVIGDLPGGIAETACLVEQFKIEAAEARLIRRQASDPDSGTTRVGLAVQRIVIGKNKGGDLGGRKRGFLQRHADRGLAQCDQRS